ncbi:helix-turn-helix domain-containing protein [Ensifer canadensis]|nr:helix-turn-helix domain-containing protein [Ensifer canadensis]
MAVIGNKPCAAIFWTYIALHSAPVLAEFFLAACRLHAKSLALRAQPKDHFMTVSINNLDASTTGALAHVDIGDTVRRSRQAIGYSVDELALTCGLTDIEITNIELGVDTDPAKLRRIAAALQLPLTTFLLS